MGRTNPTYRDDLRRFRERWQPFRRALRRPYQARFDALLEGGERFADAAGFQAPTDPERAVLLSMLLAHQVDLSALEERLDDLEGRLDAAADVVGASEEGAAETDGDGTQQRNGGPGAPPGGP